MNQIKKFPEGFLWGTATAAHQIEGNNSNSDWWQWEQSKKTNPEQQWPLEESGIACDSYNRFEQDFDLCKKLNNNAVRISIEWARIYPSATKINFKEIEHYKKVLMDAQQKGLKTFVTLHHFTSPIWIAQQGGWSNFKTAEYFAKYAQVISHYLDPYIDAYLTINEPHVFIGMGYSNFYKWFSGSEAVWPPHKNNLFSAIKAHFVVVKAHRLAYKNIKKHSIKPVGIVKNIVWNEIDPKHNSLIDNITVKFANFTTSDSILWLLRGAQDFIGVNYYFTNRIHNFKMANPDDNVSDLRWWINPKGLEKVLTRLKKYNLPIYVTENGLADAKDTKRTKFIKDHLTCVHSAISKGANVKGYFYWSLIDNYEWHQGFWPRFGLVEIDREKDLKRIPRKSFTYYSKVCKSNAIVED